MTAVFVFVFMFGLAATALFCKVSVGSASLFGIATFLFIATVLFIACYKLTRQWEGPELR
ncbi:MAG: hypothetical protein JO257_29165 [Deltaproteobacteria bacterium]|nr:hypothetical protein [Deltaproteobacteria bacterium]